MSTMNKIEAAVRERRPYSQSAVNMATGQRGQRYRVWIDRHGAVQVEYWGTLLVSVWANGVEVHTIPTAHMTKTTQAVINAVLCASGYAAMTISGGSCSRRVEEARWRHRGHPYYGGGFVISSGGSVDAKEVERERAASVEYEKLRQKEAAQRAKCEAQEARARARNARALVREQLKRATWPALGGA